MHVGSNTSFAAARDLSISLDATAAQMTVTFLVAFSAVVGVSEAIRQTQAQARRKEHRSRKNNLIVHCPKSSLFSFLLEGRQIVLSGDKLYIDTGEDYDVPFGHPFAGYFLAYPDVGYSGLVSTICEEPPIMNWIYVDRETYEVKFGVRQDSQPHYTGPFDCTRQDRRLTFGGWEGFCVVKEGNFYALYFDVDSDRLKSKLGADTPVVEVELLRVEMRVKPPAPKAKAAEDVDSADAAGEGLGATEKWVPEAWGGLETPDLD